MASAYWVNLVEQTDAAGMEAFLESVDASDFSLKQWIEAFRVLGEWLDSRGLELEWQDRVGYVSCAADSAGASSNLTDLPVIVIEMLETYGCDRAEKA